MKKQFTHITLIFLTLSLVINLLLPSTLVAFADTEEDYSIDVDGLKEEKEKDESTDEESTDSERVSQELNEGKGTNITDSTIWTTYAQFIMTTKKKEDKNGGKKKKEKNVIEKAVDGAVSGIIGDGGVSLDIPYNKMYSLSNSIRGKEGSEKDNTGTQVASFLATNSYYNYIDTVSGNRVASESSNAFAYILKLLAGFIICLSLAVYYMIDTLLRITVNGIIAINPFALLGFGDEEVMLTNPIAKAINQLLIGIGLDSPFFTALTQFGLIFVVAAFGFKMMKYLSDKHMEGVWKTLQKFGVQIFTMFAIIPLLMLIYSEVGKGIAKLQDDTPLTSDLASQHILNVRGWASSQNLAPNGLYSTNVPEARFEQGHVDKSYDPPSSRQMIADINSETYNKLYGKEISKKMGFQLVQNWMKNSNFNVNTYFGDIQRPSLGKGDISLPAHAELQMYYPSVKNKEIEYVMWSGTQNVSEKLRDVTNKQFKPDKPVGVYNNHSFSTQSVALMLQSSFDEGGAHFYAYNLAPKGLQGNMKNLSTVKTEWKSYTMPGEGVLGIFASALSLTSKSLGHAMLGVACMIFLLTVNLFETAGRFIKCIVKAVGFGKFNQATASFFLAISILVSALIAFLLPQLFVNFVTEIVGVINKASNKVVPSGLIDMIGGFSALFLCYYLGYGAKVGGKKVSPVKSIIGLPNDMALAYADKMDMLSGDDIKQGFKQGFKGAKQEARKTTRDLSKTASETVQDSKRRLKGASKGAVLTGAKETAVGFTTSGVGGVKGISKGAYNGATDKEGSGNKKVNTPENSSKDTALENNLDKLSPEDRADLGDARDLNEFSDRLRDTNNGEEIALSTQSSSNALQGTSFVDNNGNVSREKIDSFRDNYNQALEKNDVTPEMERQHNQLEHAYNVGAEEIYDRKGTSYFVSTNTPSDNISDYGNSRVSNTYPKQSSDFTSNNEGIKADNSSDYSSYGNEDVGSGYYRNPSNLTRGIESDRSGNHSTSNIGTVMNSNGKSESSANHERNNQNVPSNNRIDNTRTTSNNDGRKIAKENNYSAYNRKDTGGRLNRDSRLSQSGHSKNSIRERRLRHEQEREERIKKIKESIKNRNNTPD